MSYSFGDNFKAMRKQRDMTQEAVAEALGVSSQAISKWETNVSCPDIQLLPGIADFFGVSVDRLLGHDNSKRDEMIDRVCAESADLIVEGRYREAVPLLREGLLKYPGNEKLMYALAWALSGTGGEYPENYEEAIVLYQKILQVGTDTEIRAKAARDLIYRYYTKREIAAAMHYANQLPTFEVCKEYNLGRANLLEGRELSEFLQANIQLFGQALLECLEYFENEKILTVEEKLPYTTESAKRKIELLHEILGSL